MWKDRPRHDAASHGADAFLTFACSNYQPPSAYVSKKRDMHDEASHGVDAFLTFACPGYKPPATFTPRKRDLGWVV